MNQNTNESAESEKDVQRTIAVVLGDNDFGNTFKPLLETVYRAVRWNDGLPSHVIETAIRSGIEFHYVAFQHGKRAGKSGNLSVPDTVSYLSEIRILFDEEAEADIQERDHDSGAWYLELATGQVYAY